MASDDQAPRSTSGDTPDSRSYFRDGTLEELQKYLGLGYPNGPRVTFARYTGQESDDEREKIKNDPPDILLTNYVMLEYILTRQDPLDQKVISDAKGLEFLVLDELHTYRGR